MRYSRLEPRALCADTVHSSDSVPGSTVVGGCTQGGVERVYTQGGVYPGISWVVYIPGYSLLFRVIYARFRPVYKGFAAPSLSSGVKSGNGQKHPRGQKHPWAKGPWAEHARSGDNQECQECGGFSRNLLL